MQTNKHAQPYRGLDLGIQNHNNIIVVEPDWAKQLQRQKSALKDQEGDPPWILLSTSCDSLQHHHLGCWLPKQQQQSTTAVLKRTGWVIHPNQSHQATSSSNVIKCVPDTMDTGATAVQVQDTTVSP